MQSDARWMRILAFRVLANALLGAVTASITGAVCLELLGVFSSWLFNFLIGAWTLDNWKDDLILNAIAGMVLGGIPALFIFGIASFKTKTNTFFVPFNSLAKRVIIGQFLGTLTACLSYLIFTFVVAQSQNQSYIATVGDNFNLLPLTAVILLVCGAIAGALSKRDWPKAATLNAE